MLARLAACVFATLLTLAAAPVRAQEVDRIAAVVNDGIISNRDLDNRIRVAMMLSHLPDTMESRRRIVPQVLRKMIDEHLQMQEAKRLKIALTDKEIDNGIAAIEHQAGMPPGGLKKQFDGTGIPFSVVRHQITADLTWMRVASAVLRPTVHVSNEEIADRLAIIKAHRGKPEYLAAEIYLPVDNLAQEDQVRNLGERLIEQLRQGTPFPVLASQFSQSPTAANGGSLGWVSEGTIDDKLLRALTQLVPGQITPLIRIEDGYHILGLVNRRIAGSDGANDPSAEVTFSQIILPLPASGGPPKDQLMEKAMELTHAAQTCDAFEAIGHRVGATKVGRIGPVRLGTLPPPVARLLGSLGDNQMTPPMEVASGLQVLMMCQRTGVAPLPTADEIRRRIENERLDMLTQRYLRNLRRAAFIDIRM